VVLGFGGEGGVGSVGIVRADYTGGVYLLLHCQCWLVRLYNGRIEYTGAVRGREEMSVYERDLRVLVCWIYGEVVRCGQTEDASTDYKDGVWGEQAHGGEVEE